jgi:pyruvate dehydrogenase E2 component (dihydrolipoamide acetyltransferase)
MPKLGLTMEEAMIIEWLVADGEHVEADTPILLIETDKTETEVGAPGSGRLHQIGKAGDVYPCGERIGLLLGEGEAAPVGVAPEASAVAPAAAPAPAAAAPVAAAAAATVGGRILASPNARRVAAERGVALASVRGTGPGGRIVSEDVEAAPVLSAAPAAPAMAPVAAAVLDANRAAVATVAARNLADLLGVDLSLVAPDPAEGRITRDSVALYVRGRLAAALPPPAAPAPTPPAVPAAPSAPLMQEPTRTVRLAGMRGTIAKRMTQSLREMAQLTLTMDADMEAVLTDRAERRATGGVTPSITDYVVAATAKALERHPMVNSQVTADGIAVLPEIHVGLAVAVDGGLLVPVVRDTLHRDLEDLSTLGMYGVDMFTPVINPPNAGILGVGRLRDDLVLVDGEVRAVKRMTLSLTWDHRVLDGAPAAEFCKEIATILTTW